MRSPPVHPAARKSAGTCALQRDAQAYLDRVTADRRGSGYVERGDSRQTFGTWHTTWSALRINLKGSTEAKVHSLARVHGQPASATDRTRCRGTLVRGTGA